MYPAGFDRADATSPFLSFVASEFQQRGTERRKELAQKIVAHPFVEELGMRVPQRIAVLDDLDALSGEQLPDRFVLKLANGWSSRGVMILQRIVPTEYFDHMSLRSLNLETIAQIQMDKAKSFSGREARWIVEEAVLNTLTVGAIPFDYKFYCFQGVVGLVVQIDRNSSPVKVVLFDGAFRPLKLGSDYLLGENAKPGVAVVPLNGPEMLWWAQRLSTKSDSPFVSIDLFDSPSGPVFGEFTYSPGGLHRRMFVFSQEQLDRFDRLFAAPSLSMDALAHTTLEVRKALARPGLVPYAAWAGHAYGGGGRGAERLHAYYRDLAAACEPLDPSLGWYRRLSARWAGLRDKLQLSGPKGGTGSSKGGWIGGKAD